jgi:hypothetical protein
MAALIITAKVALVLATTVAIVIAIAAAVAIAEVAVVSLAAAALKVMVTALLPVAAAVVAWTTLLRLPAGSKQMNCCRQKALLLPRAVPFPVAVT